MSTPITDHASVHTDAFDSPDKARNFARRLETDRAALMEACEFFVSTCDNAPPINLIISIGEACKQARAALSAARANFPQP